MNASTHRSHRPPRRGEHALAVIGALLVLLAPFAAGGQSAAPTDTTIRRFGGGVYLFHYRPVDLPDAQPLTEVYAAYATADVRHGRWQLVGEARARDSKLRPWMNGTAWVQQAWVGYDVAPRRDGSRLVVRAGKIYQVLGRFWDGSFFGNVQYFDGLKLNPEFGVEVAGRAHLADSVAVGYTAQYLANSDRVSGALAGRDFETVSGVRDADGGALRASLSLPAGVTLGIAALSRGVEDSTGRRWRAPHGALDGEWRIGPAVAYAEWTRRGRGSVPGTLMASVPGSRAEYRLAGAQWRRGIVHLRYNFSRGRYEDAARTDWIHQPGVTLDLARDVRAFVEWDEWHTRLGGSETVTDRSVNVVLHLVVP